MQLKYKKNIKDSLNITNKFFEYIIMLSKITLIII